MDVTKVLKNIALTGPSTTVNKPIAAKYIDLGLVAQQQGKDIHTLPYVIRILLENVQRHLLLGRHSGSDEIAALLNWQDNINKQLSLHVERVILPDSSGLPVLQDLAALRTAILQQGGDPTKVDVHVPVDLIVDHSLQVDHWGHQNAIQLNLDAEFQRNTERYQFLKWAQTAFTGLKVYPPGTGIIHQANLEHIATVVSASERYGDAWVYPDFVIGGDSHTPMVNGLGVLGWGVGGIDAEAALLGRTYSFPIPEVVGVQLIGAIPPLATTTDAALLITQRLREAGVSGCAVEYFGPAVAHLPIAERATIANMAPEYGATCGLFPVDQQSLDYLRLTGRSETQIELVERYTKANALWAGDQTSITPTYARIITIDLNDAQPAMSGPRRPQDRLLVSQVAQDFQDRLHRPVASGGFGVDPDQAPPSSAHGLAHGRIIVAAIASCTNTSNPSVMLAAGLIAQKARARGLTPPNWVKRSLAPGSRAVTNYLQGAGLLPELEALGFNIIGYGCTTCGGKSGPLSPEITEEANNNDWVLCSVLSGNRNFEGRIHRLARANYIGSPAMVVAYALAGRIDIDFDKEPLGTDPQGQPVWLHEIWPSHTEVQALLLAHLSTDDYQKAWQQAPAGAPQWERLKAADGALWPWDEHSSYLVRPPFFDLPSTTPQSFDQKLQKTRVLGLFGDSLTTDHISPSGEIPIDSTAGRYLLDLGIPQRDFNTYVGRRGNFEVMVRGTFANVRIRNLLAEGREGGWTRHFPTKETVSIYEASQRYLAAKTGTIILAGKEYGTGSSRDWAAKGTALLGVQAVIAESYERIHRANLIGMGVLPLAFKEGQSWRSLNLDGSECYSFINAYDSLKNNEPIQVIVSKDKGQTQEFFVWPQIFNAAERDLLLQGGILLSVLHHYLHQEH